MHIRLIGPAKQAQAGKNICDSQKFAFTGSGRIALALPTIAALTPKNINVSIIDDRIDPMPYDEVVDLVGITTLTNTAYRAYEIADEYRKRGIPVVLGGIHASVLPEEAIQHADAVVIGEAEGVWAKLIEDLRNGTLQKFYKSTELQDLTNAPIPRWDLVNHKHYRHFSVQTSRGCPYRCEFCSVHMFSGNKIRRRSIKSVVEELKSLTKLAPDKLLLIADDNILAIPSYARELMEALKPLNLNSWWCQASINRLGDDEMLSLMYDAGCRAVIIGLESISEKSLDLINKTKVNNVDFYKKTINKIQSHGIAAAGSFIFGHDTDDDSIFEDTAKFIDDANMLIPILNVLTPYPGTELWKRLKKERRILHDDWNSYNTIELNYVPKMAPRKFLNNYLKMVQEVIGYESFYNRYKKLDYKVTLEKKGKIKLSTKILLTLVNLKPNYLFNRKRLTYMFKTFWNPKGSSVSLGMLGMRFNDFFEKSLEQIVKFHVNEVETIIANHRSSMEKAKV